MKKTNVSLFTIFTYTLITTGVLFSCKNNPTDEKTKGFPQVTTQNNNADKTSNGNIVNFVQAAKAVTPGVFTLKRCIKTTPATFPCLAMATHLQ